MDKRANLVWLAAALALLAAGPLGLWKTAADDARAASSWLNTPAPKGNSTRNWRHPPIAPR